MRFLTAFSMLLLAVSAGAIADTITVELTTDALGLGSTEINYAGNDAAVEADRPGKLVTSTTANVGSVLTIQTNGLAGPGDMDNPLLVTVTARTHMDVKTGLPAGYDFQAGVITLTDKDNDVPNEGLGVRGFGIDLDPASPTFAKRYVNPSYTATNVHGFQMEGSKEVSGGVDVEAWADFIDGRPIAPSNMPPHVDEDVIFDFNNPEVLVAGDSVVVLLTKIKAGGDSFTLALDLTIDLVGGTSVVRSYDYLSDAPDVFSEPAGYGTDDNIMQLDFSGISLGLESTDIIDSFTIGGRDDPVDDPKETDEHFLINGFSANFTPTPEPATLMLIAVGVPFLLKRSRR